MHDHQTDMPFNNFFYFPYGITPKTELQTKNCSFRFLYKCFYDPRSFKKNITTSL